MFLTNVNSFRSRYNAYRFFIQNLIRVRIDDSVRLTFDATLDEERSATLMKGNVMDSWILSSVQTLIIWFRQEMSAYRLYTVVPRLVKFIDQLTNWYVRLNRRRHKVLANYQLNMLHRQELEIKRILL